ncbi:MAG: hypothetical protein AAFO07_25025 [Bacteroidota bacterium]
MKYTTQFILLFLIAITTSCVDKIAYLDNDYPGLIPKKYAVGTINIDGRHQQNMTMSPDGKEHLFTVTDAELWRYETILRVKNIDKQIVIDTPQFVMDFKYENEWFIGEPMISPNDQSLYFVADYPPDIWSAKRTATGDWSEPNKLTELSTEEGDWYVTLSRNDKLYFTNNTVYQATLENGRYTTKNALEKHFNQKDTQDPCISPNEDYMIFTAEDTTNNKRSDLFISFHDGKGNWSKPQSLGENINTEYREFAPYISPDEQFLFFSRRDKWQNAEFSNIYWVSLKIVDQFQ